MTRKLIFVVAAALGIVWSGVSEAKVCRLGDEGCETSEFFGTGDGQCDASYKPCLDPRAGATYCYGVYGGSDTPQALYRDEDCCSTLAANGYQECSINEGKSGYGLSCRGAWSNKTYWQYCGCSYGFVEYDEESNTLDGGTVEDIISGDIVPYETRCGKADWGFGECRFAQCNEERRFFFEDGGAHCKYRLDTRCGGFGCMQVYDCNHDVINDGSNNAKEYYRNENQFLADGLQNFIPFNGEDFVSNERLDDDVVKLILATSNSVLGSEGGLVEGIHYEEYNVVNRFVCRYELEDGSKTTHELEDAGGGFKCNSVPNYCYLWDGCNEDRRWYNSGASTIPINAGAIYDTDTYYQIWLNTVEKDTDYHPEMIHAGEIPQHLYFYTSGGERDDEKVNPYYGVYEPIEDSIDGRNLSNCTLANGCIRDDKGCTYIRGDCHQDGTEYPNHRCWKKVSCTEENRFYASFMNAATISVDKDGNILAETNNLYESSLSEPYYTGFYGNLEDPETEIYPACVYEINNCNDATGCYRKSLVTGCIDDFEDVREHLTIEDDWTPWFEFLYPLCNDSTRCYKATSCDLAMGAYSSEPNTLFFQTISSTATGLTCYKGVDCYYEYGAYSSEPNTSFFSAINSLATGSICYRGESCHMEAGSYSSVPNLYFFKVEESVASGSICYRGIECLGLDSGAYTSEPNTSFFEIIGSAASGSTCYRGTSCHIAAGSYSSVPNTLFFELSNSSASGSTCYRGDSCYFENGVYSSEPNTSFFENINSLASGSTCYRGQNCNFEAGNYTSEPNTLFFDSIYSIATGSTCYRGQGCDIIIGSYSSEPNTLFFDTISSQATGSICYRGEECNFELGAYTSEPNTSFFGLISSKASGSTCYRGDTCHVEAGAYSSTPNTLFFAVYSSTASGSTCYRGVECLEKEGGVYSSSPNTEFFNVIHSLASSSGCYRGESCNIEQGSYSSEPNTSFFEIINSSASGSTCYRGEDCHLDAGAYNLTLNEAFFKVIESNATGLTCYRGEDCNIEQGAYSSEPNTVFFVLIDSIGSGSICYRAEDCAETAVSEELKNTSFFVFISSQASGSACYRSTSCRFDVGAYSSEPNTSFFDVISSLSAAQDSTCYRGGGCNIKAGAYSSAPNTSFFTFVTSEASGSISYRADGVCLDCGAYSSTPNTSFFSVVTSSGSGSIAYRAESEHIAAGSYKSEPNTSFFLNISSVASGSVSYRSEESHIAAGAYSSSPNTLFFNVVMSYASGSISYRADSASSDLVETNTSFFLGIHSLASGSIAYRSEKSHLAAGAYSSTPNTSFFYVISSYGSGSTSYRAENTHFAAGAYTSEPNTIFFTTIHSIASGSTAYRADDACLDCGSYRATPNTSFFLTNSSMASGSISYRVETICFDCGAYETSPNTSFFDVISSLGTSVEAYRAQGAHLAAGSYSSAPNTSFFLNVTSEASGSIAYRGEEAHLAAGSYTSEPNLTFFIVDKSLASGSTCYRGAECALSAVSEKATNSSFFLYTQSEASGSICYRSSACRLDVGAYSSSPNTSFFSVLSSTNAQNDSTCYRTEGCNIKAGAYSTSPNTSFFRTVSSEASGSVSYRAEEVCPECGAYSSTPNTSFFFVIKSSASGSTSYRAEMSHLKAGAYTSSPNTLFFNVIKSLSSGSTSYRAESVDWLNGNYSSSPNTLFFSTISSHASGSSAYRADTAKLLEGAYTSAPNTSFFIFSYSHASGIYAYRGDEIHLKAGAYSSMPNTMFFNTIKSLASGTISYRADMICKAEICGHRDPNTGVIIPHVYTEKPNTSFFDVRESLASGSIAYRAMGHVIPAYSSSPNTSFFIVISSKASGSTAYRGESSHIAAGAYSSTPNPLFFDIIVSHASGSISYRAERANFNRGAYTSKPNTSFFIGLSSHASGSTSYRTGPVNLEAGAYTSTPNTLFFYVINSKASGSIAYRGETAHIAAGAYSSTPNTKFFTVVYSLASGSKAYRASGQGGGGYSKIPNTSFFNTVSSLASGLECYRSTSCRLGVGTYTSAPNSSFFSIAKSVSSGSTCYRGADCSDIAKSQDEMNNPFYISDISGREYYYKYFFGYIYSKASGSTCYRARAYCSGNSEFSVYTNAPNTSYFVNVSHTDTTLDGYKGTCYAADHCHTAAGAYSTRPSEDFFVGSSAIASEIGCFRGVKCVLLAYSSSPNTSFFNTIKSLASGSTCYRATSCNTKAGAYTSKPNTMYFNVIESIASGVRCYRAEKCQDQAINTKLSTSFFVTTFSNSSGTDCYRGDICHQSAGAYTDAPNAHFFAVAESHSPTKTCYRGTSCSDTAAPKPNTSFFRADTYESSISSGSECFRGKDCNAAAGAYTDEPDTLYFKTSKKTEGTTCYRATGCNASEGAITKTQYDTSFFKYSEQTKSSSVCYRATACHIEAGALESVDLNTVFFKYKEKTQTDVTCYRVSSCSDNASDPKNTSYFVGSFEESTQSGKTCYRGKLCHIAAGAYSISPNTQFFVTGKRDEATVCYRGTRCNSNVGSYSSQSNYFYYIESKASGSTCYRATSCSDKSEPNKPYFDNIGDVEDNEWDSGFCGIKAEYQTGIECWRPVECPQGPCENEPCGAPTYDCIGDDDYLKYCECCEAKKIYLGSSDFYLGLKDYFVTKQTKDFAGVQCYSIVGCTGKGTITGDTSGCDTNYFTGIYDMCGTTCGKPAPANGCYLTLVGQGDHDYSAKYNWTEPKSCGAWENVYHASSCNVENKSYPVEYFNNKKVYDNTGTEYYFSEVFYTSGETDSCSSSGGPTCHTVCSCTNGWTYKEPQNTAYISVTTDLFSDVLKSDRTTSSILSSLSGFGPDIRNGMLTSEMTAVDVNKNVTSLESSKSLSSSSGTGATCYKAIECDEDFEYYSKGYNYYISNKPASHLWLWQASNSVADPYCTIPGCQVGYELYNANESTPGMSCNTFGGYKCCKEVDYFCPDYMYFWFDYSTTGQMATETCGGKSTMCAEKLTSFNVQYYYGDPDPSVNVSTLKIASTGILDEGAFNFGYEMKSIQGSAIISTSGSDSTGTPAITCTDYTNGGGGKCINNTTNNTITSTGLNYYSTQGCSTEGSCKTFNGFTSVKFDLSTYKTGDKIYITLTDGTTTKACNPTVIIADNNEILPEKCPDGYYTDEPDSAYYTYVSETLDDGTICYKATGCSGDYTEGGCNSASADYHGLTCSKKDDEFEGIYYYETWPSDPTIYHTYEKVSDYCYKLVCDEDEAYYPSGLGSAHSYQASANGKVVTCYEECPANAEIFGSQALADNSLNNKGYGGSHYYQNISGSNCYTLYCKYPEGRAGIMNTYNSKDCPAGPCQLGGGSLPADERSLPANKTYFDYDSITHSYDGTKCYYNISCKNGYEYKDTGNCETWGGATCCQACSTGQYYFASTPSNPTSYHKYTSVGGNCYTLGCQDGYSSNVSQSVNTEGATLNGVACYKEIEGECSAGYYKYSQAPDSNYFITQKDPVYEDCYLVTGCQVGYVDAEVYTNKGLTVPSTAVATDEKTSLKCYDDLITFGYYFFCDNGLESSTSYQLQTYGSSNASKLSNVSGLTDRTCPTGGNSGTLYPKCNLAGWLATLSGATPKSGSVMTISGTASQLTTCGGTASLNVNYKCTYQTQSGETRYFCTQSSGADIGSGLSFTSTKDGAGTVNYCGASGSANTCAIQRSGIINLDNEPDNIVLCRNGTCKEISSSQITKLPLHYNTNSGNLGIRQVYYGDKDELVPAGASVAFNKGSIVDTTCPDGSYYYGYASPLRDDTIYEYTEVGGNGSGCYKIACNETIDLDVHGKTSSSPLLSAPAAGETASIYTEPLKTWDTIASDNGIKCYLSPQPTHIVKYYETFNSGAGGGESSGNETCYNIVGVDFIRGGIERYDYNSNLFENIEAEDVSDRFTIDSIGTSKCSGGYLEYSNSTSYYIKHLRSNVEKSSILFDAIYTCNSQGRGTACIDKFYDYRSDITAGSDDRDTLTPSIGNCHYSEDDFDEMTPYEPNGEHSFYHSKSGTIYTGKTLTLIEENDLTRRNAEFGSDQGFVTISIAVLPTNGTLQGYGDKTLDISYASSEVRVPEGVNPSNIRLTTEIYVECSGGETGTITHIYENGGNNKPSSVQCVGSYTTAPTAEIKVTSVGSSGIPAGYGLRYELKELQGAGSGKYDDLDGGIIKAPTGYGVATKSSNKWGGRCTSPLNYEPDIPVPQCPAKVTYTISYTKDTATTMKDISVKYDVAEYKNVSIYNDIVVTPYVALGEEDTQGYEFADCLTSSSSGSCSLENREASDGTLDIGLPYNGIAGTTIVDGNVEICVNNKVPTFCDDVIVDYETTIDLGSDCPSVPVEVVVEEINDTCPDGYYYYYDPSTEQDLSSTSPYTYTKHSNSSRYPNCYSIECKDIYYFNEFDEYDIKYIIKPMRTTAPALGEITQYEYAGEDYMLYTNPVATTDTTAINNGATCYLPPKEPTMVKYYYDTNTSGDETCYSIVGVDYLMGEMSFKYAGTRDEIVPVIPGRGVEDVSDAYRIVSSGYSSSYAGYDSCKDGVLNEKSIKLNVKFAPETPTQWSDDPYTLRVGYMPYLNCDNHGAEACIYRIEDQQANEDTIRGDYDTDKYDAKYKSMGYCVSNAYEYQHIYLEDSATYGTLSLKNIYSYKTVNKTRTVANSDKDNIYIVLAPKDERSNVSVNDDAGWITIAIAYDIDHRDYSTGNERFEAVHVGYPEINYPSEEAKELLSLQYTLTIPSGNGVANEETFTYTYENGAGNWDISAGCSSTCVDTSGAGHSYYMSSADNRWSMSYSRNNKEINPFLTINKATAGKYGVRVVILSITNTQESYYYDPDSATGKTLYETNRTFIYSSPEGYGLRNKSNDSWGGRCTENAENTYIPPACDTGMAAITMDRSNLYVNRLFSKETVEGIIYRPITDFYDISCVDGYTNYIYYGAACKGEIIKTGGTNVEYDPYIHECVSDHVNDLSLIADNNDDYDSEAMFSDIIDGIDAMGNTYYSCCIERGDDEEEECPENYPLYGEEAPDTKYFKIDGSSELSTGTCYALSCQNGYSEILTGDDCKTFSDLTCCSDFAELRLEFGYGIINEKVQVIPMLSFNKYLDDRTAVYIESAEIAGSVTIKGKSSGKSFTFALDGSVTTNDEERTWDTSDYIETYQAAVANAFASQDVTVALLEDIRTNNFTVTTNLTKLIIKEQDASEPYNALNGEGQITLNTAFDYDLFIPLTLELTWGTDGYVYQSIIANHQSTEHEVISSPYYNTGEYSYSLTENNMDRYTNFIFYNPNYIDDNDLVQQFYKSGGKITCTHYNSINEQVECFDSENLFGYLYQATLNLGNGTEQARVILTYDSTLIKCPTSVTYNLRHASATKGGDSFYDIVLAAFRADWSFQGEHDSIQNDIQSIGFEALCKDTTTVGKAITSVSKCDFSSLNDYGNCTTNDSSPKVCTHPESFQGINALYIGSQKISKNDGTETTDIGACRDIPVYFTVNEEITCPTKISFEISHDKVGSCGSSACDVLVSNYDVSYTIEGASGSIDFGVPQWSISSVLTNTQDSTQITTPMTMGGTCDISKNTTGTCDIATTIGDPENSIRICKDVENGVCPAYSEYDGIYAFSISATGGSNLSGSAFSNDGVTGSGTANMTGDMTCQNIPLEFTLTESK